MMRSLSAVARPTRAYRVTYRDGADGPTFSYLTYAYSVEHAGMKFYDAPDADGWELVSIERPKDPWGKVDKKFDRALKLRDCIARKVDNDAL